MSKSISNSRHDYSQLDRMSTEELREILRLDFLLPDDEESDMDAILYVMQLVAERERKNPTGKVPDVREAWASFVKNYLPYLGDGKSLYDFGDDEDEDI